MSLFKHLPVWWNGRHAGFKIRWRKSWRFESAHWYHEISLFYGLSLLKVTQGQRIGQNYPIDEEKYYSHSHFLEPKNIHFLKSIFIYDEISFLTISFSCSVIICSTKFIKCLQQTRSCNITTTDNDTLRSQCTVSDLDSVYLDAMSFSYLSLNVLHDCIAGSSLLLSRDVIHMIC